MKRIISIFCFCLLCLLSAGEGHAQTVLDHNNLVGTDRFGRSVEPISSFRQGKQVGIFFFLWLGQPFASGIYDNTEILARKDGKQLLFHQNDSASSPAGQAHFWGKPLWGYYNSADEWVIRKQIRMLTAAGVDFLVFDATNALTYRDVYMKILAATDEYLAKGWNPPKVAFYTNSSSARTVKTLYEELYKPALYPRTWYRVGGKPMIIAYADKKELPDSILGFFHFKKPQWPNEPFHADGFAWMEWTYPQPLHTDMMNVAVACHPQLPFSASLSRDHVNWGRGWNPATGKNEENNIDRGTFFQREWEQAIKTDPATIFVTGWNEWIAYKYPWSGEYMFCDAVSRQYSRDIEPMAGGYEDAFYLQLIRNIRSYKGIPSPGAQCPRKKIDINKPASQWQSVSPSIVNMDCDVKARDSYGASQTVRYTANEPANQLKEIKVASDNKNLYFYIECTKNITEGTPATFPTLLIGSGKPCLKGWNGYEYKTGTNCANGKTSIGSIRQDFSTTPAGEARYTIQGNILQLQIPRKLLNREKETTNFYFKAAIDITTPSDIMDYYSTGSAMPLGRLSYMYHLLN